VTQPVDEGDLRLVREFVNTRDIEAGTDDLSTPADLTRWLREHGLGGSEASRRDLAEAVTLREAIRTLLEVNHDRTGGPESAEAAATLTAAARRFDLHAEFTADSVWRLAPGGSGVEAGLGGLVALITQAMSAGTWRRLKVCRNDACRWAFFDTSRSGAGKWCSMAVCGNREKARAWRARQRVGGPG
jgi:predicted RNA-binding Zn ribbon-like protein